MDTTDRPTWPKILLTLATFGAFAGVLMALHFASDLIGPLFVALNLLIAAWPVRTALLRRGVAKPLATTALGLVVFLVLGLGVFALYWGISSLIKELPDYQAQFTALYHQLLAWAESFGITQAAILEQLQGVSPSSIAGLASSAVSSVSGVVTALGVVAVMLFMLILDSLSFDARSRALERHQPDMAVALEDFVAGVRRYWVVTSVFGLIVAVLDVGVLLVLGVPLAFVWGIISFLTNYIPNVGFLLGVIPPALMAILAHGPTSALIVVIAYSAINFVIQSVIQPKFNGDAVGVTALVSFLSLLLWSAVLGPIGALLGLPMTLLFKALLIDHDPGMRWFNLLIASDAATSDPQDAETETVPTPEPDAEAATATA